MTMLPRQTETHLSDIFSHKTVRFSMLDWGREFLDKEAVKTRAECVPTDRPTQPNVNLTCGPLNSLFSPT